MRTIERTTQFKRDVKREMKGRHRTSLVDDLVAVLDRLVADDPLPPRHRDHPLTGQWSDHRDCHIKPDLVLIYSLRGLNTLTLIRLGSHSELGL